MDQTGFQRGARRCVVGVFLASLLMGVSVAPGQTAPEGPASRAGGTLSDKAPAQPGSLDSLLEMADKDIGQLSQVRVAGATGSASLDMPVSSVSRQESTVGRSPAAVFVITNEMIRRSGAKEIPEVLRMVPGLDVAKIDSNKWAVSVRGFNHRFANKLLVRIDGRDVYTPLFAGTFWDVQDVLLEDVERIEVIRGPGATVWGANAVNGVINIITKNAQDTQGVYVEVGGGTYQQAFTSARYGGQIGDDLSFRLYGKWFDRAPGYLPGDEAVDAWNQGRGGFRLDWNAGADDTITFQGDYYNGYSGDQSLFPAPVFPFSSRRTDSPHVDGGNALVRWKRIIDDKSDWTAKIYYDRTQRHYPKYLFAEDRDTVDFDFQHRFPLGNYQELIWGLGYRFTADSTHDGLTALSFRPQERAANLYSCFLQDQIALSEDVWYLTLGSKFELNDYTGFEYQPTVRLLWTPSSRYSLWTAVSRAVRIPARYEDDGRLLLPPISIFPRPVFPLLLGNRSVESEQMLAYEAGIRGQPTDRLSWDFAMFYNDYEDLITLVQGPPMPGPGGVVFLPRPFQNAMRGETYGFELAANYKVRPGWRLQAAYTMLRLDLHAAAGSVADAEVAEGQSPRNQVYLQSSWDLGCHWELDLIGRYADHLPAFGVSSYIVGDARLCWHCEKNLELSVVGRNLLKGPHQEFGNDPWTGTIHTDVEPEVYGQLVWRY